MTRYDVCAVMPFRNHVATALLTGADVQALLTAHPDTIASGDVRQLDPAKTYRAAFVDYEARTVYKVPPSNWQDTGHDLRDAVIALLKP